MGLFDSIIKSVGNSAKNSIQNTLSSELRSGANKLKNEAGKAVTSAISKAVSTKTTKFTFAKVPESVDELKGLKEASMKEPFGVAALTILALCAYAENKEVGLEMIDFLNGPEDINGRDRQFLNDRVMDGKGKYLFKSYFEGAKPENNYTVPAPFNINIMECAHSRDNFNEGYLTLYIQSGGADSPREVKLRTKPSTGEWFLWSYEGLTLDIRIPVEENKWA